VAAGKCSNLSLSKWRRQNPVAMQQSGGSSFHHSTNTCVTETALISVSLGFVATPGHAETRLYTVA
jgi:hypothetical protein